MTISDFQARWHGHTPRPLGVTREYAVLVPLVEGPLGLSLLFEVRADTLSRQPGEVCFPGGHMEPGETPAQCALRETWEELGVPPELVGLIGPLDFQCGPGDFALYPVLGTVEPRAAAALRPSPAEVKETFCVPVSFFRTNPPAVYRYDLIPQIGEGFPYQLTGIPQDYPWRRGTLEVPVYQWEGRTIWGMTARTLRSLIEATG